MAGHRWHRFRWLPWLVCWPGCGLIWLKNETSRRAAKGPCRGDED